MFLYLGMHFLMLHVGFPINVLSLNKNSAFLLARREEEEVCWEVVILVDPNHLANLQLFPVDLL